MLLLLLCISVSVLYLHVTICCANPVDLAGKLRQEMPLQCEEYFWTDSTVVLGYIQNVSARFKVFVANRVQKIHDGSCINQWFHVDSAENPADDGSRAVWSDRWLQGPDFLKNADLNIHQISPTVVSANGLRLHFPCLESSNSRPRRHLETLPFSS